MKSLPFPIFDLPASIKKNKRAARLWVLPNLWKRLRRLIVECGLGPDDILFTKVPHRRVFDRDRDAAGISPFTSHGKATFHSLRSAGNRLLRKAGLPVNIRKMFMRHSDIRLTDATYDDAILLSVKEVVPSLEKYGLQRTANSLPRGVTLSEVGVTADSLSHSPCPCSTAYLARSPFEFRDVDPLVPPPHPRRHDGPTEWSLNSAV